jgi:DNA-binding transcriptional LysR family regulator
VHLFDDELCLCVSTQSAFAGRTHIDWPELSRCTLVGPYADNEMWRQLSMLGIRPRRRIYVSNAVLATRFIADEHALALLYRSVALDEVAQGRLAIVGLPAPTTVPYWMATSIDAARSPLVQKFVSLLQSHVRSFCT